MRGLSRGNIRVVLYDDLTTREANTKKRWGRYVQSVSGNKAIFSTYPDKNRNTRPFDRCQGHSPIAYAPRLSLKFICRMVAARSRCLALPTFANLRNRLPRDSLQDVEVGSQLVADGGRRPAAFSRWLLVPTSAQFGNDVVSILIFVALPNIFLQANTNIRPLR
jgi:hypothetical protein